MLEEIFSIGNYTELPKFNDRPLSAKLLTLGTTYLLVFIYVLLAAPFLSLAEFVVTHVLHFSGVRKHNTDTFQHMFRKLGHVRSLIYICLVGPVLEECVFRLPLSFKRLHVGLGFAFAVYLFSSAIPAVKQLAHAVGPVYSSLIRLGFAGSIFFISFKLLPADLQERATHKKMWIIISISLFGLMHIANFIPLQWSLIWIYPVYVLPQIGMGWALSYIRFKNGFIWGIALHCLINSVSMLLSSQYHSNETKTTAPHLVQSRYHRFKRLN